MKDALIYVDTAEKKPLVFPDFVEWWTPKGYKHRTKIHTEVRKLDTADYVLASHPGVGGVERKNGPLELHENFFTDDSSRFEDCLTRLARDFTAPAFYIESTLTELDRALKLVRPQRTVFEQHRILDRLLFELARARIVLLTGTGQTQYGKRQGGELVARYLLAAAHGAS
jgi:hypothetical protein